MSRRVRAALHLDPEVGIRIIRVAAVGTGLRADSGHGWAGTPGLPQVKGAGGVDEDDQTRTGRAAIVDLSVGAVCLSGVGGRA